MTAADANFSVADALGRLRKRYAAANPTSLAAHRRASRTLPGGNTRSVLHFDPFPLTMERGSGAEVWDADGHGYIDCVGEFSAGIYGHSDPIIKAAILEALEAGVVMGAPTRTEVLLAEAIRARFPSMELLRFCNSGTEANILAIVTALAVTGRRKVLVFREAYHGGVLVFPEGGSPINLPFEYVLAAYNDIEDVAAAFDRSGEALAAVIVEPILGAGGNIPGSRDFLAFLRRKASEVGALLIFDEVKTSRCGPGGIQGQFGITPDLTTLGKYIGGGLSTGAFGGRRDIMERYDPTRTGALRHAGTFNNNVCSMAAGLAGLTKVFTPDRATQFLNRCEALRTDLNEALASQGFPMQFVGLGSLATPHFAHGPIGSPKDIHPASRRLAQILHLELLLNGVLLASRGDMFLSLPMSDRHFQRIRETVLAFADSYGPLVRRELASATPS